MIVNSIKTAQNVSYDNREKNITKDNVQGAIDELVTFLANGKVKFQVIDGELQYSVYTE